MILKIAFYIVMLLAIIAVVILIPYFTVRIMKIVDSKEAEKAMEAPIKDAKEMGLNISSDYKEKNEILVIGKNYAFVMKYSSSQCKYYAIVYERESGESKLTISSTDYNSVLKSAKELAENLDKI